MFKKIALIVALGSMSVSALANDYKGQLFRYDVMACDARKELAIEVAAVRQAGTATKAEVLSVVSERQKYIVHEAWSDPVGETKSEKVMIISKHGSKEYDRCMTKVFAEHGI